MKNIIFFIFLFFYTTSVFSQIELPKFQFIGKYRIKSKKYETFLCYYQKQNALRFENRNELPNQIWYGLFLYKEGVFVFENSDVDYFLTAHESKRGHGSIVYFNAQPLSDSVHNKISMIEWNVHLVPGTSNEYFIINKEFLLPLTTYENGRYYEDTYIFEAIK